MSGELRKLSARGVGEGDPARGEVRKAGRVVRGGWRQGGCGAPRESTREAADLVSRKCVAHDYVHANIASTCGSRYASLCAPCCRRFNSALAAASSASFRCSSAASSAFCRSRASFTPPVAARLAGGASSAASSSALGPDGRSAISRTAPVTDVGSAGCEAASTAAEIALPSAARHSHDAFSLS